MIKGYDIKLRCVTQARGHWKYLSWEKTSASLRNCHLDWEVGVNWTLVRKALFGKRKLSDSRNSPRWPDNSSSKTGILENGRGSINHHAGATGTDGCFPGEAGCGWLPCIWGAPRRPKWREQVVYVIGFLVGGGELVVWVKLEPVDPFPIFIIRWPWEATEKF